MQKSNEDFRSAANDCSWVFGRYQGYRFRRKIGGRNSLKQERWVGYRGTNEAEGIVQTYFYVNTILLLLLLR
jgi:hypothetical protein